MLITKNYYLMCKEADPDLKLIYGGEGFDGTTFDKMKADKIFIIKDDLPKDEPIKHYIPTQQQLQHIIVRQMPVQNNKLLDKFNRFVFERTLSKNASNERINYLSYSFEELWLCLLMEEIFKKEWVGARWLTSRPRENKAKK